MVTDLTDDTIEGGGTSADPEMETITLDGEEIEVPKTYAEKLKNIEMTMKSGLNKKHEAKVREDAARLRADKDWLNAHADRPDLWEFYEPTVEGGRGFIGREDMLGEKPKTPETKPVTTEQNSEVAELRKKVEILEERLSNVQTTTEETSKSQAVDARETVLAKYKFADKEILTKQMEHYYLVNKYKHPSPKIIEEFAKAEHNRIAEIERKAKDTTIPKPITGTTTLPKPSNISPSGDKKKLPRIDDIQGIVNMVEGMNFKY